jgi:hypothetical protein
MMLKLIKPTLLFILVLFSNTVFSQSAESKRTVKKIIKLSTETEFSEIAKMFDTTNEKKPINPFLLDYTWRNFEDTYGKFINSRTIKEFKDNTSDIFIEELQFDSAFVEIKVGISQKNGMVTSYLLQKQTTKKTLELEKKYRLPKYAIPRKVVTREAEFGDTPYRIYGELTLPDNIKKKDKVPVVILVHGSGPGDRNEKGGPLQPFKDIAYGLTTKGIAVLRYDKRTLTYGTEVSKDKSIDLNKEVVDDVLFAANYLREQKNIDADKIYVLGHSLGGMMLPRIGTKDTQLAGLIFMAAPARNLADAIIEQMDYLTTLKPENKKSYDRMREDFVRLKTKWYDSSTNARYLPFGLAPSYWMDVDQYKQTEVVKNVLQPMLFLQGDADYQVTVEDFELWKTALKHNNNATYKLFPRLHHQMAAINHEGLSTPDDYEIPANVDEAVINAIYNWIVK